MLTVTNNILAINAERQLKIVGKNKSKNAEKLASGYRINRASDDAAGLAISEKMRRQIRGLTQAVENCQDGISLCQAADGAMAEVHDMIHRMTELCVQAANGTNTDSDREVIDKEIQQIKKEIDRVGNETTFNKIKILQGNEIENKEIIKIVSEKILVERKVGAITYGYDEDIKNYLKLTGDIQHYEDYTGAFSIDFRKVTNQEDWKKLDGAAFYFTCTQCDSVRTFIFDNQTNETKIIASEYKNGANSEVDSSITFLVGTKDFNDYNDLLNELKNFSKKQLSADYAEVTLAYGSINIKDAKAAYFTYSSSKYAKVQSGRAQFNEKYEEYTREIVETVLSEKPLYIQCGAETGDHFKIVLPHIDCEALEMTEVTSNSIEKALESIDILSSVLQKVSEERSRIGVYTKALEHLVAAENNTIENTTAAESVIRDYDMAKGMVEYSVHSILEQVGTAMIAQANYTNENILKLLQ